jgi:hypothetical protein
MVKSLHGAGIEVILDVVVNLAPGWRRRTQLEIRGRGGAQPAAWGWRKEAAHGPMRVQGGAFSPPVWSE